MYTTNRHWLRYGREDDYVEVTTLEHKTFKKALKYTQRYARGVRFVRCSIENEAGRILYEICDYGAVEEDYRTEEDKKKIEKENDIQIRLTQKELSILEELECYDTKFEAAKNDVGTDFLSDYYNDWDNLKILFEDWAFRGTDYYFQYKGLHFICRIENIYNYSVYHIEDEEIESKDVINLIQKLNIKTTKEFNNIKNKLL